MSGAGDSRVALSCLALVLAVLPATGAYGEDQLPTPLPAIVKRMQQRYDATSDFTADVTQAMTIASLGKTLTVQGAVSFKRPGKLRWQPREAEEEVIVADGSTLWLYQPEERQVLKTPFDSEFRASTPILFLLGIGLIEEQFDVSLDPGYSVGATAELEWLKLTPRHSDGTVGWMRLGVDRASADVAIAEIHDQLGNVTRLQFTNVKRGVGLDDSVFRFQVPEGVDVVDTPIGF